MLSKFFFSVLCIFWCYSTDFRVLFSNSDNGNVMGCNCSANPKSGMIKRSHFIKAYLQKYPGKVLLLSGGDIFKAYPNKKKAELTVKVYQALKFDAVVVGEQEIINGIQFLQSFKNKIPLLSANLKIKKLFSTISFTPFIIKSLNGIKVAVIGITGKNSFKWFKEKKIVKSLEISDEVETARKIIKEIKDKCDVIILLTHQGIDKDKILAQKVSGIDFIIGGHKQELTKYPIEVEGTTILQAGGNGNWQGELIIYMDGKSISKKELKFHFFKYQRDPAIDNKIILGEGEFKNYQYKIHEKYPDDQEILNLYNNSIKINK